MGDYSSKGKASLCLFAVDKVDEVGARDGFCDRPFRSACGAPSVAALLPPPPRQLVNTNPGRAPAPLPPTLPPPLFVLRNPFLLVVGGVEAVR